MPLLAEFDQWSTAKPLLSALPQWLGDEQEKKRIGSYQLYEQIYWSVPDTFQLVSRGKDAQPIYIPAPRTIVETLHRYLAPDFSLTADPDFGTPQEQELATQVMTDFAAREAFYSKFNTNKRYGIIRGDWCWHLYADPNRPAGSRLSIFELDPGSVFPIYNPDNVDEVIGYHVVEQYTLPDEPGKVYLRRLTYRKKTGTGGPSPIDVTDELYEVDKSGLPGMEQGPAVRTLQPPHTLPSPIDQLPVYHVRNFREPSSIWGSSELRGLERVIAALNQSISDEELALALEGLGVYATTAGTPVDDEGNEVSWNLGPGRVVELPETNEGVSDVFARINGVSTVAPYQEHIKMLLQQLDLSTGMSPTAKGDIDVQVAESGIAKLLDLAPLLAKVKEKEQIVTDTHAQMAFDLRRWFIAYEGGILGGLENIRWVPEYGDAIPKNRDKEFEELMLLAESTKPIVSMQYVRQRLRMLGYDDMPDDTQMMDQILEETEMLGKVATDAMAPRIGEEMAATEDEGSLAEEAATETDTSDNGAAV